MIVHYILSIMIAAGKINSLQEATASPRQRDSHVHLVIKESVQSHLSLFADSILPQSCNLKQLSQSLFLVIFILGQERMQ